MGGRHTAGRPAGPVRPPLAQSCVSAVLLAQAEARVIRYTANGIRYYVATEFRAIRLSDA